MPSQVITKDLITMQGIKSDLVRVNSSSSSHHNHHHNNHHLHNSNHHHLILNGGGHKQKTKDVSGFTNSSCNSNNNNNNNSDSNKLIIPDHNCDIYCTECEIAAKKSRTLLLSTGGDVIINSSFEDLNSSERNWMDECSSAGVVDVVGRGGRNGSSDGKKSNFSVNLHVPTFDFRTHRLVISVNIENRKISDDSHRNLSQLKQSGWYFEALNYLDAQNLLQKTQPGTFLLRNSSDSRFLFSLSVQTDRGPTSVRITYMNGKFQLDADDRFNELLPKEDTVVGLLENHVKASHNSCQVWVEPNGRLYSPVLLTKPLKKNVPTLQHLARVAVNCHPSLKSKVPPGIRTYMAAYPHRL